jgi:hypothetical protein
MVAHKKMPWLERSQAVRALKPLWAFGWLKDDGAVRRATGFEHSIVGFLNRPARPIHTDG